MTLPRGESVDMSKKPYLSHAEKRVAELVIEGLSNDEIAGKVGITSKTVKFHLTNIFKKLDVSTRARMIVTFYKKEWSF